MTTLLVTGFDPFGSFALNPSELIATALHGRRIGSCRVIAQVLPTAFAAAEARVRQLIRDRRPAAVLGLGLGAGLNALTIEMVALNADHADVPDNAGEMRRIRAIVPGGPLAYAGTLPVRPIVERLGRLDIPSHISFHAGTFVCNHVFYVCCHEIAVLGLKAACGFVHLPLIAEQPEADGVPCLPLEVVSRGVREILRTIGKQAAGPVSTHNTPA